jgi:spermidine synthase
MLLLGASLPIAARIVIPNRGHAGRHLGVLYAGNTAGAILGAWTAGFFLLPTLGSQHSIMLLAAVNAATALALALASGKGRLWAVPVAAGMVLGALLVSTKLAPDMYRHLVAGHFPGRDIVWIGEGLESSVAVVEYPSVGPREMYINGIPQASDEPGTVGFHRLLAHIPMILHDDPQDVLIVGIGGGTTAGALAAHNPRLLEVVELSHTVVQGAGYFSHINGEVLRFPNLTLKIDDGRNHLLLTDRKYDVVTADVIHPHNAGSAVLYSYEYYALAARALKRGGIMAQWLENREDNPDSDAQRRLMARTFLAAFPHATLWALDSLLIGSNEPIDTSLEAIRTRWDRRDLGRLMRGTTFQSPEDFRTLHSLGDAELRAWAGEGPIMTDDRPYVEYFLSMPGGGAARN